MDQRKVVLYARSRSLNGWRAARLLRRIGCYFDVIKSKNHSRKRMPRKILRKVRRCQVATARNRTTQRGCRARKHLAPREAPGPVPVGGSRVGTGELATAYFRAR